MSGQLATLFRVDIKTVEEAHQRDVERTGPLPITLRLADQEAAALTDALAGREADATILSAIAERLALALGRRGPLAE